MKPCPYRQEQLVAWGMQNGACTFRGMPCAECLQPCMNLQEVLTPKLSQDAHKSLHLQGSLKSKDTNDLTHTSSFSGNIHTLTIYSRIKLSRLFPQTLHLFDARLSVTCVETSKVELGIIELSLLL